MRLTLRTLLAYMDDVLDPADHAALGDKIESSDFAADLIHKTRDTMRRLRLGAPELAGRGMGLDPNSVAEYLDNTLPAENVGDFERVCLESDVHLAEAASCHQILTMVLGEPADVDPATRQRMYQLPTKVGSTVRHRVESGHPTHAGQEVSPEAPSHLTHVPDYLREPAAQNRGAMRWVVAALVLAAIGFWAFQPGGWLLREPMPPESAGLDPDASIAAPDIDFGPAPTGETDASELAATSGTEEDGINYDDPDALPPLFVPPQAPPADSTEPVSSVADGEVAAAIPDAPIAESAESDSTVTDVLTPAGSNDTAPTPFTVDDTVGTGEQTVESVADEATATTPLPVFPSEPATAAEGDGVDETATSIVNSVPTDSDAGVADMDTPAMARVATDAVDAAAPVTGAADVAGDNASAESAGDTTTADAVVDGAPAAVNQNIGTFLGSEDVLLRYDGDEDVWWRVGPPAEIVGGLRYLALPTYRPTIGLAGGAILELSGGTAVEFERLDDGSAALEIVYGRAVLTGSGGGSTITLRIGDATHAVLLGAAAQLAIEVSRTHAAGRDPTLAPGPVRAKLFVTSGEIRWDGEDGSQVAAPAEFSVDSGGSDEPIAFEKLPEWIDHEPLLASERRAKSIVGERIDLERPAGLSLLELVEHRRSECRSLATRCSAHVGRFEPFVDALGDSAQKAEWKKHIKTLRVAMALSPEVALKIYGTLTNRRGAEAEGLFEMLRGYGPDDVGRTKEEMQVGALPQLIDWLNHERLDYRVLALHNLHDLTHKTLGGYAPWHTPAKRQRAQKIWYDRLRSGELIRPM